MRRYCDCSAYTYKSSYQCAVAELGVCEATHLDGLVRSSSDQARACHVESRAEHARFRFERARLRYVVHSLERRAGVVIPQRERAVVTLVPMSEGDNERKIGSSPPEKNTPSELTESVLMIAFCPLKLKTKVPSGHFHFLMLFPPADAEANEYSVGCIASARTDFLWCVRVVRVLPAARSHNRTVESMLPVMT